MSNDQFFDFIGHWDLVIGFFIDILGAYVSFRILVNLSNNFCTRPHPGQLFEFMDVAGTRGAICLARPEYVRRLCQEPCLVREYPAFKLSFFARQMSYLQNINSVVVLFCRARDGVAVSFSVDR